jgi:hypothetical protein
MSHVPSVKTMLAQLPAAAYATISSGSQPVILDGWKNPIIYVPSGGLTNVYVTQGAPTTTSGVSTATYRMVTVQAQDGRPFWASAGQDGDFSFGDDNLYSTAVVYH